MAIIGLTGSFGTGKTFVASEMKKLGAVVIDADEIAHDTLKKGSVVYKRIVREFGRGVLGRERRIDRRALGRIVFCDKSKINKLNSIVHPEVIRVIKTRIAAIGKKRSAVIDAPLLIEANAHRIADYLVVVSSSRKRQIRRCVTKFGMSKADIEKRIRSQIPLARKIKMSDFVVDNDGTKHQTRVQVRKIWEQIRRK